MAEDQRVEHLKLGQAGVNRLAGNSFLLKGWSVTLVSALLALSVNAKRPLMVLVAFLPVVVFWVHDAFYLRQERLFRELHKAIAHTDGTAPPTYDMDASAYAGKVSSLPRTMVSITVWPLYAMLVVVIVVVCLILTA